MHLYCLFSVMTEWPDTDRKPKIEVQKISTVGYQTSLNFPNPTLNLPVFKTRFKMPAKKRKKAAHLGLWEGYYQTPTLNSDGSNSPSKINSRKPL